MKNSVHIERGKFGYFLIVDGYAIKRNWDGSITATKAKFGATPTIASEWASISILKSFWNQYKSIILTLTK